MHRFYNAIHLCQGDFLLKDLYMKSLYILILGILCSINVLALETNSNTPNKIASGETSLSIKTSKQLSYNELLNSTEIPSQIIDEIIQSSMSSDANEVVYYVEIKIQSSKKVGLRTQLDSSPGFPVFPELGDTVVVTYTRVENGLIWEYRTEWEFVKLPNGEQQWVSSSSRTFKGFDEKYFAEK